MRLVSLTVDSTGVEICATLQITAQIAGGESKQVHWYVNGTLGGAAGIGTISQTNPATFTAPYSIPDPATVIVKAVSREDTTKADSCQVTVKFTVIHVSASSGSDEAGTGCLTVPYKTIKRGLAEAGAGMTVMVAPGIYDAANGEVFPIAIQDNIGLVGEDWTTTVISGHEPTLGYRSVVTLYGVNPSLRKFTVEIGEPAGEPSDVPIYVGATGALVDSIRMTERGNYSDLRIESADSTTVSNCWFVVYDGLTDDRGFEIVFGDQGTIVRNCTISGFHTGLFFNGTSDALVEWCVLEGNDRGIEICCPDDPNSDPSPDIGGGARGSAGGNIIQGNLVYGLYHRGTRTIFAKYNTWNHHPPTFGSTAGSDIYLEGTGDVDWE